MADEAAPQPTKSKKPLLIGAVLMALCAAGGYGAVAAGLVPGLDGAEPVAEVPGGHGAAAVDVKSIAFIDVEPLVVTYPGSPPRHLRFHGKLEVPAEREGEVTALMPRVKDVMLGYLNAIGASELQDRAALMRLRAQMLRRVRMVAGQDAVRDLLVMEYVTN